MPELTSILIAKRDKDYEDKKFLASIQGIDLEGKSSGRGQKEWEDMKARVFSGGSVKDSSDIVSLQGASAWSAGFGIGNGLEYYGENAKNPIG